MKLRFVKIDPSGNTTIIILDPVARGRYAALAARLMEKTSLCAEQVGYLEPAEDPAAAARICMMGGEFCGNAARSFAAWIAMGGQEKEGLHDFRGPDKEVTFEISGHSGLLTAKIRDTGLKNACEAVIAMPLPAEIRHGRSRELGEYSIAVFEGIVHVILWDRAPNETFAEPVRCLLKEQDLSDDCFGVIFYDSYTGRMFPLVSVEAVGSLVWESSCGSGSVAVAAAVADKEEKESIENMELRQPGGNLYVSVSRGRDGTLSCIELSGRIGVIAEGVVFLADEAK
jgi:histidine racemase